MVARSPNHVTGDEEAAWTPYRPSHPVRFVTAASLFDGHDASINIMRRLLQAQGAEVVHLGHNRSVDEVVRAAVDEDVQGVAVSSYQGGHLEYFRYLVDRLRDEGRPDIRVYGGGGGVIVPAEIEELEAYGVDRIFSPADGQRLGLARMINLLIEECDRDLAAGPPVARRPLGGDRRALARTITRLEAGAVDPPTMAALTGSARSGPCRSSASPGPGDRGSRRSPTSWSGGSATTRRTSCRSPCWRSTPRGGGAGGPCSGTASG